MLNTQHYIDDKIEDYSIVYTGVDKGKTLVDVSGGKFKTLELQTGGDLSEELFKEYGGSYVVIKGEDAKKFGTDYGITYLDGKVGVLNCGSDSNFKYNLLAKVYELNNKYKNEVSYYDKEDLTLTTNREYKYLDMNKVFKDITQKEKDDYLDKGELSFINLIDDILNLGTENGRTEQEYYKVKYEGWLSLLTYTEHLNLNKELNEIMYKSSKDKEITQEDKTKIYQLLDYYLGYLVNINNKHSTNKYYPKDLKVGSFKKYKGEYKQPPYVISRDLNKGIIGIPKDLDVRYEVGSYNNKLFKFGGISDGSYVLGNDDIKMLRYVFLPSYNSITSYLRNNKGEYILEDLLDLSKLTKDKKKVVIGNLINTLNRYVELENGLVTRLYKVMYVDEEGDIRVTEKCNIIKKGHENYYKTYVCQDKSLDYNTLITVYKLLETDYKTTNSYDNIKVGEGSLSKEEYQKALEYQREYSKLYQDSANTLTDTRISEKWGDREQDDLATLTKIKEDVVKLGKGINGTNK